MHGLSCNFVGYRAALASLGGLLDGEQLACLLSRMCCVCLQVPQECPEGLADLINRCTAKDPTARPTAKEVVDVLTRQASCDTTACIKMRLGQPAPGFVPSENGTAALLVPERRSPSCSSRACIHCNS